MTNNIFFSSFLIPSICLVLFFIWLWKCYKGRRHKIALLSNIPCTIGIPLYGNAIKHALPLITLFKYLVRGVFRWMLVWIFQLTWMFKQPEMKILTPEAAQFILSSSINIEKSNFYKTLHPWLGRGLLTSTGHKWHAHRKILTPTFHFKILGDFLEVMNEQAKIFVDQLRDHCGGYSFDIAPYITRCAIDVICETAMGVCVHAQANKELEYTKAVKRMSIMIKQRMNKPWLSILDKYCQTQESREFDKCLNVLHDFTRNIIKQRKQHSRIISEDCLNWHRDDIGPKKRFAFLDHLLEISHSGEHLKDEDIQEEVDTFMYVGHDTAASAIGWACYLIGRNPQVQARIHAEQYKVFKEDRDRPATMEDIRNMYYLECCIKEALRLFPAVPSFGRNLTEDLVCDKYTIPADSEVNVIPFHIHRDPNHWQDPEVYNPDRFSSENCTNRHPFAFIPFSAGPRNCIGQKYAMMEVKIILSTMFRNYSIESVVSRENLNIVIGDVVLKSDDGILIKLHHQ